MKDSTSNDELNLIRAGDNMGWRPELCGSFNCEPFTDPLMINGSQGWGAPVNIIGVGPNTDLPSEFLNDLLFLNWSGSKLWRVRLDPSFTQILSVTELLQSGASAIISIAEHPNGTLYVGNSAGEIRIIEH